MKCKNCNTENLDNEKYCKKCGKPFNGKQFKLNLISIGIGTIMGLILLFLFYILWGNETTFYYGTIPSIMLGGCVATILAYNKNVKVDHDFNSIIQGVIAGTVTGILLLLMIISQNPSQGSILIILIPGYIFWSIIGSIIGFAINYIRVKDVRLIIPFLLILISIIVISGSVHNTNQINNNFVTALSNQYAYLTLDDFLQEEADYYLNKPYNNTKEHESNLKEAQKRYQRLIDITSNALLWNDEMLKTSTTDTQKEFSKALGEYIKLKLSFFNTTKQAIDLEIQGKNASAQTKYQEAEKLITKINAQQEILNNTLKSDKQLQTEVEKQIKQGQKYYKYEKEKGELLTSPTSPP